MPLSLKISSEEAGHAVQLPCIKSALDLNDPHSPDSWFNGVLPQLDKMSISCKVSPTHGVVADHFLPNTNMYHSIVYTSVVRLHTSDSS